MPSSNWIMTCNIAIGSSGRKQVETRNLECGREHLQRIKLTRRPLAIHSSFHSLSLSLFLRQRHYILPIPLSLSISLKKCDRLFSLHSMLHFSTSLTSNWRDSGWDQRNRSYFWLSPSLSHLDEIHTELKSMRMEIIVIPRQWSWRNGIRRCGIYSWKEEVII